MTDEQINVAIAEACGLRIQDVPFIPAFLDLSNCYFTDKAFHEYRKGYPNGSVPKQVPSYTTDLNAMHEAEKTLDGDFTDGNSKQYAYADILYRLTVPQCSQPFRATARQRAEAFLRTIGKWIE